MAKEKSLKSLKVKTNKDGTLTKKSREDVLRTVKPSVLEKVASRIDANQAVEGVGFAGLVAANYYGLSVLPRFLPEMRTKEQLDQLVSNAEDAITLVATGVAGLGIKKGLEIAPGVIDALGDFLAEAMDGFPKRKATRIIKQSFESMPAVQRITALETLIPAFEKMGVAEETLKALRDELQSLQNPDAAEQAAREKAAVSTLQARVIVERLAWSIGFAYLEKKFFESYTWSQAVENIPFIQ